ncbi:TetR/AcrR family transcriptional regulator [Gracilibacillus alcaliphilus]|uniref:TetR/AcrR family transcriptional regulator n=1 Tax=Gracilibacillus alcaliphilus TaxID=1401441 RepID=UPI00195AF91B|nr:TetR/AcrR family transcriptional regulator [Gracilibacillus alcaliphilus]MBM7675311.1 AcrR family transcriptional regulator [Gracilibacillus alcaliphilus]
MHMPKIVDHEKRKQLIAEATWSVISKQGIHLASSRTIAKEAGLSQGALRHYFSKQEDLLLFAMDLVKQKLIARLKQLDEKNLPPVEKAIEFLLEFLPTNQQTLIETEVWFAFVTFGKTQTGFNTDYEGLQKAIKDTIIFLKQEGQLKDIEESIEQEKLYAFINGLAVNLYIEPDKIDREASRRLVVDYLNNILLEKIDTSKEK